jgi:hypothetical protein
MAKKQIPDNSEPWLPGGVRSVADALWISDQIKAATEREYLAKLPIASAKEAAYMLGRFLTPKVAEAGLRHPDESIRQLSLGYLKELVQEGDPFAHEILEKL